MLIGYIILYDVDFRHDIVRLIALILIWFIGKTDL